MANYIKIPLSLNPGRPIVVVTGGLTGSITTNSTDATTLGSPTAKAFTTSGNGTSGAVALTVAAGAVTVASATTAGDGYKVGDTLTFDKSVIGGTTDVVITLVADDLAAIEGSATNEYQLIPIDSILAVDNSSTTVATIVTNNYDDTANAFLKWTVTLAANQTPANTEYDLVADLCDAINEASQAENSVPVVSFFGGTVVEDVDYA
jgi:hypothetical protein|tara:strand:- start:55 stop:672 length:618 start_codon:yes stop_codon:yes gene_type:complete